MNDHFLFKEIPQLVYETDCIAISLIQNQSLLLLVWKRQIDLPERKQGFNQGLAITNEYKIKNWLVDDLQLTYINDQEKEWIITEWIELAAISTIRKLAVVTSEYFPALTTNTEFTNKSQEQYQAKSIITHEVFTDYTTALEWLNS